MALATSASTAGPRAAAAEPKGTNHGSKIRLPLRQNRQIRAPRLRAAASDDYSSAVSAEPIKGFVSLLGQRPLRDQGDCPSTSRIHDARGVIPPPKRYTTGPERALFLHRARSLCLRDTGSWSNSTFVAQPLAGAKERLLGRTLAT
jgi:hypothetical protein